MPRVAISMVSLLPLSKLFGNPFGGLTGDGTESTPVGMQSVSRKA